jgi:hypothetical protein
VHMSARGAQYAPAPIGWDGWAVDRLLLLPVALRLCTCVHLNQAALPRPLGWVGLHFQVAVWLSW